MKKLISIVIPVYNESANVPLVYRALRSVLIGIQGKYDAEIIFVNDGSKDSTWDEIVSLAKQDSHVRGICFSRNFGQQYALEAGFAASQGDAVITMDADMENPPAVVPELLRKWEEGFAIVNTRRTDYGNRSWFKSGTSRLFYRFINLISDVQFEKDSPDFRLLDREVVDVMNDIREGERFYRGLVQWMGFESTVVPFKWGERVHGQSTYNLKKFLSLAWTAITSFSTFPMKAIMGIGAVMFALAMILMAFVITVRYILGIDAFSELAVVVLAIMASNGITLMALGIMALYMLRMYKEVQRKPNYVVRRTVNLEHERQGIRV
jgi:dolichol-phosphate mannosyltransferase